MEIDLRQRPRVLLVEDDASIRSALELALTGEGYQVRATPDGSTIDKVATQFRPDLAILDIRLAVGPDGYTVARQLRSGSDLPVLFVTAADSLEERLAGFEAGGDDYIVKPFAMAELLARVQALLRRSGRVESAVRQIGDLVIDDHARVVTRGGATLHLTRREFDLLSALTKHPGRVLSRLQLLNMVWGSTYGKNLIEVNMSTLRRKLEAHGPRLVHTVRGVGYVVRTDVESRGGDS